MREIDCTAGRDHGKMTTVGEVAQIVVIVRGLNGARRKNAVVQGSRVGQERNEQLAVDGDEKAAVTLTDLAGAVNRREEAVGRLKTAKVKIGEKHVSQGESQPVRG